MVLKTSTPPRICKRLQVAPLDRHSGVLRELAHGWAALPGSAAFLFEMIGCISTRASDRATWSVRWLIRVKRRTDTPLGFHTPHQRPFLSNHNGGRTSHSWSQPWDQAEAQPQNAPSSVTPLFLHNRKPGFGYTFRNEPTSHLPR